MKNKILPLFALAALSLQINAQSKRAFAVTSETRGTYTWNAVREIDLSTGEVLNTYYDKSKAASFEVVGNQTSKASTSLQGRQQLQMLPMADGVAATAFDEKHNRLYFTPMRGTDLRYFDLNSTTGRVVYNQTQPLFTGNRYDEANVITRMTFAADGFGYALTNDGNNLVRFTTDQKPAITNLGELIDGKNNGSVSVHNLCTSWGGDMVGDAYGNLYLVSMRNHVFKINPQTRVADHLGAIKGLPEGFTTNGMAVNENGEALLSSAAITGNYYRLNISTMEAMPVKNTNPDKVFNASDLASSNLLYQNRAVPAMAQTEVLGNQHVSVYPNPVSNKTFTIRYDKLPAGRYNLVLVDAAGKNLVTRTVAVNYFGQVERISLPRSAAGMYMLKVVGENRREVYTDKIIVQ